MAKAFITSKKRVCEVAIALIIVTLAPAARADKHACVEASEDGQRLRKQGKLTEARAQLQQCADDACPDVVKTACAGWLEQVDHEVPTLVLGATDASASNADVTDVRVAIDGNVVTEKLDGRAFPVDPGPHALDFFRGASKEHVDVLVREGDKNRSVVARFNEGAKAVMPPTDPKDAPADVGAASGLRLSAFVVTGVAAASLVAFTVVAIKTQIDYGALQGSCGGSCAPVVVAPVHGEETATDVMLGVTIGLAVVATLLFVVSRPRASASAPAASAWIAPGGFRVAF